MQVVVEARQHQNGSERGSRFMLGSQRSQGTEIGRLGGYGFRGTVTAGDGSSQKGGKMEAGYVNLQDKSSSFHMARASPERRYSEL